MTLTELKATAEAATPGPWNMKRAERDLMLAWHVEGEREELIGAQYKSDAAFIAAANPRIVLAMIEFVRQFDRWETHDNKWSSAPGLFFDVEQARAALDAVLKETGDV